jgi:predicted acyltransferase
VDRTVAPPNVAGAGKATSQRLLSLDVYRGMVIFAMLIVNNLGDGGTTGYFWKHADWPEPWLAGAFAAWWRGVTSGALPWYAAFTQFPVFRHCTLADYVMPSFMLIIGLAIPYAVAASAKRGVPARVAWFRTVKRACLLVVLGWVLVYFRDQFAGWLYGNRPFTVSLGMDVLQLLGVAYLVARVGYALPKYPRVGLALALFVWHWALLRFWPQGDFAAGTFTEKHNAVGYAYATWPVWKWTTLHVGSWLTVGWVGMLSVPPAAATMLLGTVAGDWLRRTDVPARRKVGRLALWGAATAAVGLAWAFDLPFNKPRWTPCYLMWVSGVGFMVIALLYWVIDMPGGGKDEQNGSAAPGSSFGLLRSSLSSWTYPFIVFGSNAIAVYFLSILVKVLVGNSIRVQYGGEATSLANVSLLWLKSALGPWAGGWAFTVLFVGFWWVVLEQMYRRKWFWKL